MTNERPVIALDIDGVVSDICRAINSRLERMNSLDVDYSSWLLSSEYKDKMCKEVMDNPTFWKNLIPFDDAWYQVNKWFGQGCDIHIVTARRSDHARNVIQSWFDGWRISFSELHICEMGHKAEVLERIQPLFMVEDNPHEVKKIIDSGFKCYLRKAWYNSDYWDELPSIGNLYQIEPDDNYTCYKDIE